MSEEITETKEEEKVLSLPTTKDVEIDVIINDVRYNGIVSISLDDCHDINLHNLLDDYDLMANANGKDFCKVCHILAGEALWKAGEGFNTDIVECCETGYHADKDFMVSLDNTTDTYCFSELAFWFDNWDCYVRLSETETHVVRDGDGYQHRMRAPASYFDDMYYCNECGCYVDSDDYYGDDEMCRWCYDDKQEHIIEGYTESHDNIPIYYGDYKDEDSFVGLGFELEVDCSSSQSSSNNSVAAGLCEASGLEPNEMRFAYDGSLNYGFECISQPHTVKDFWSKQDRSQQ